MGQRKCVGFRMAEFTWYVFRLFLATALAPIRYTY